MIKNEVRAQMVNEICDAAQLFVGRAALFQRVGEIVDKHLSRLRTEEDTLTADSYRNPLFKLMRSEAYSKGCYGCAMSFKDRRNWRCLAEIETDQDLNYPNASRSQCEYGVDKKRKK